MPSDGYCPRYVMVAGEERPEIVPISIDYVCTKCRSAISVDEAIMLRLDIESVIHECQVWHLGMLRYGTCWRLWTQITGNT